jgi:transcriptional regulator with XRE-family HTH domain
MGFKEDIAKIFKEAREKKGLTQEEVAKKAKVSVNYYARIERADPMPRGDVVNRIAKALGTKINLPLD